MRLLGSLMLEETAIFAYILYQVFKALWVCPVAHKDCCVENHITSPNRAQSLSISILACWSYQQLLVSKWFSRCCFLNPQENHMCLNLLHSPGTQQTCQDLKSFLDSREKYPTLVFTLPQKALTTPDPESHHACHWK